MSDQTNRRTCFSQKPPVYTPVRLFFSPAAEQLGYWNGTSWIAEGFAVSPLEWEPVGGEPKANDPVF
jgi:hypothetical protein